MSLICYPSHMSVICYLCYCESYFTHVTCESSVTYLTCPPFQEMSFMSHARYMSSISHVWYLSPILLFSYRSHLPSLLSLAHFAFKLHVSLTHLAFPLSLAHLACQFSGCMHSDHLPYHSHTRCWSIFTPTALYTEMSKVTTSYLPAKAKSNLLTLVSDLVLCCFHCGKLGSCRKKDNSMTIFRLVDFLLLLLVVTHHILSRVLRPDISF